jgi:hypothetical protein
MNYLLLRRVDFTEHIAALRDSLSNTAVWLWWGVHRARLYFDRDTDSVALVNWKKDDTWLLV